MIAVHCSISVSYTHLDVYKRQGKYTATINIGTEKAEVTYTVAKSEHTEPVTGEGYDIDYSDEEITADSGYELSADGSTVASSPLTVTPGTDVYVRRAEDDNQNASDWVRIEIPERPEAPTAVSYTHLDVYKRQILP